jgi:SAM-dependent methyltransferase
MITSKSCPTCGSSHVASLKQVNGWDLSRCAHCRLIWAPHTGVGIPENFYSSDYFHGDRGYADYQGDEPNIRRNAKELLSQIPRSVSSQRKLLDLGCAYGYLLDEAAKLGWHVCGVDLFEEAVEFVRTQWKIEAMKGYLEDARYPSNAFDVVTVIGSIEHFREPMRTLSEIHRILQPNGYLLLTTIDTSQFPWLYRLKPPEHLYYFSRGNLSFALEQRGFKVERVKRYWAKYYLRDYMLNALRIMIPIRTGSTVGRWIPRWPILVPTNEMFLLARKV